MNWELRSINCYELVGYFGLQLARSCKNLVLRWRHLYRVPRTVVTSKSMVKIDRTPNQKSWLRQWTVDECVYHKWRPYVNVSPAPYAWSVDITHLLPGGARLSDINRINTNFSSPTANTQKYTVHRSRYKTQTTGFDSVKFSQVTLCGSLLHVTVDLLSLAHQWLRKTQTFPMTTGNYMYHK